MLAAGLSPGRAQTALTQGRGGAGDPAAANAFIDKWTEWRADLHERVAQAMRDSERYRFAYVTYQALEPASR